MDSVKVSAEVMKGSHMLLLLQHSFKNKTKTQNQKKRARFGPDVAKGKPKVP